MSNRPAATPSGLVAVKLAQEPIVMITAYDYPIARIVDAAQVDAVALGEAGAAIQKNDMATRWRPVRVAVARRSVPCT
jgi:ketopantoate hydroxymethyltransferase